MGRQQMMVFYLERGRVHFFVHKFEICAARVAKGSVPPFMTYVLFICVFENDSETKPLQTKNT